MTPTELLQDFFHRISRGSPVDPAELVQALSDLIDERIFAVVNAPPAP